MTAPFAVMVAPNGARKTKVDHPAIPLTPKELARTAAACGEAGAAAIHIHVRDAQGGHSLDPGAYNEALAAIRSEVGEALVCQITTEAVGRYSSDQQMATVRSVRPEAVSMAVRELVPDAQAEASAAKFFAWMRRERIAPQWIVYDAKDLVRFKDLRSRGVIPEGRASLLYVLGRYAAQQRGDPGDLTGFLRVADPNDIWSVCCFGAAEGVAVQAAAALGGHARVGFENNVTLLDGTIAPHNAALVVEAVASARRAHRDLATADDLRSGRFAVV